jgi:plastocyanin
MRRLFLALAALALLVPAGAAEAATYTVKITSTGFSPRSLTINLNDRVTWRNTDTHAHQVVADNGAFASPILAPGKTYTHTFQSSGTFRYHDALYPSRRGTITVKGPPPSVSIALSAPIVSYGTPITLTVQVSPKKAGEPVTVGATPYGGATTTIATLSSDSNGTATTTVTPEMYTTYVAHWKSTTSSSVVVQVRPKLSLMPYSSGRFIVRVTGPRSFAGRYVYLQRLSSFGQWISVAKYQLGPKSGRVFSVPRRRGRTVYRVYMTVNQAGTALLDGWSGSQTVRRR